MPDPSWQEVLLSQALLVLGAVSRFAVAWLAARTRSLEPDQGE